MVIEKGVYKKKALINIRKDSGYFVIPSLIMNNP